MKLHSRAWECIAGFSCALKYRGIIGPTFRFVQTRTDRNEFNEDSKSDPLTARSVLEYNSVQANSVAVGSSHSLNQTIKRRTTSNATIAYVYFCLARCISWGSDKFFIILIAHVLIDIRCGLNVPGRNVGRCVTSTCDCA
jgi:hypothetical protein